jgi:hypothetical protein
MHGSRSKIPSKKSRPYICDIKFLALLGAPYISRLRVKPVLYSFILRSVAADGIQPKNGTKLVVLRFSELLKYSTEHTLEQLVEALRGYDSRMS